MLVPVVVRDDGNAFQLVARFHRIAAAQTLGWPKTRVTSRVKILELPERARQLIGEDIIPLAAVDQLARSARSRPSCWTRLSPISTTATSGPPSGSRASLGGCSTPP
jgi:hypothetical protein